MAKAFVYSLDALFAVVILALFILSFSFYSSQSYEDSYTLLLMEKQAGDLLTTLDKSNDLQTMNITQINNSLNNLISDSFFYNFSIEYYNYSNGFILNNSFTLGSDFSDQDELIRTERKFLVFENNLIKNYGYMRLTIWED